MAQELHFITGKGGVGKSTVALAMALKKSQEGKNVLLVELGDQSFFKDFLDLDEVGFNPTSLKKNLDISLWSGADCLKEYARHLLKIEGLYKLFFENPISRSLINVAPGLAEISITGKITSGPRHHGPQMQYDCLVIDAYATGHFLSLIKAPAAMAQAINFGPMGEQNRGIDKILKDKEICQYHIVTLPEELPVKETEELYEELSKFLGAKPEIYINKMLQTSLTEPQLKKLAKDNSSIGEFSSYVEAVISRQDEAQERVEKLKTKTTILPFMTENQPWKMIEILSQEIKT